MPIKDKLQIILITYNRKEKLKHTLDSLFSEKSPIRDFPITILNNASTDGTTELINEYKLKFPNIQHIINNKNIGGNANICRAYEIAEKEYVWVLCDDDDYNWANWKEIETAIESNQYDMIMTCKCLYIPDIPMELSFQLFLLSWVPSCIYKTSHIDFTLMANMYGNINTWFPQGILAIHILVNKKGNCYIPKENIMERNMEEDIDSNPLLRGQKFDDVHPDLNRMFWHIGYMKALRMVKDKKLRQELAVKVHFNQIFDQSDEDYLKYVLDFNKDYKNGNIDNYWDIYSSISTKYKIIMLSYLFFGRYFKSVFSIQTYKNLKIITLFGLKIKIRRRKTS